MQLTLDYQRLGSCVVLVHGESAPSTEEWDAYLEHLIKNHAPKTKILVFSRGGAPNALQRQKLAAVVNAHYGGDVPTAVMTDSQFARGVVTALGWFFPTKLAAFPLQKITEALAFLQLPAGATSEVLQIIARLEAQMKAGSKKKA